MINLHRNIGKSNYFKVIGSNILRRNEQDSQNIFVFNSAFWFNICENIGDIVNPNHERNREYITEKPSRH